MNASKSNKFFSNISIKKIPDLSIQLMTFFLFYSVVCFICSTIEIQNTNLVNVKRPSFTHNMTNAHLNSSNPNYDFFFSIKGLCSFQSWFVCPVDLIWCLLLPKICGRKLLSMVSNLKRRQYLLEFAKIHLWLADLRNQL